MTRAQIVALAGKRLGDEEADYLTLLDSFFDEVLRDLAASEAIELLRSEHTFDLVADQESYSTRTMTGLVAPNYPLRVLDIWVPTWGADGTAPLLRRAYTNVEFQQFRNTLSADDLRGRFRLWQVYPNNATVRFWPPVDAANAGTGLGRVNYLAPPASIAGSDELEQIRYEDIPTIVNGLVMYGAPYRDETLIDLERAGELYQQGKALMWGRTHNGQPGRAEPLPF